MSVYTLGAERYVQQIKKATSRVSHLLRVT